MEAVGTYLQKLRERKGLSREQIGYEIGTNAAQVFRIEKGVIDTRGSLLLRFVHAVDGSANELMHLLLGLEQAPPIISPQPQPSFAPSEIVEALEMVIVLQKNRDMLTQWISYGKQLMDHESP
jgi:transcriptional regulator with XRE-family HTH domain